MLLTEDEAREKWCPEARVVEKWPDNATRPRNRVAEIDSRGNPVDRDFAHLIGAKCLASGCMMWRWAKEHVEPPRGWCGLAGKPE